jgi:transcriptional regulator with XRE-family HTH domain
MSPDRYTRVLSQNLRSIRKSKGLTTVDLAKILGVSQAKISYIEHCKGVLSARDVAVLSSKLNIPVSEFFHGLNSPEDTSEIKELTAQLARFGAVLLAKPRQVHLKSVAFEDVFAHSLGFVEDDRLHKGLCAALISQGASKEINVDRVFAIIGNNPFLINKAAHKARFCIKVIDLLNSKNEQVNFRAKQQLEKIVSEAEHLSKDSEPCSSETLLENELVETAEFVKDCLDAKR